jgi:hypothetical protein
VVIKALLGTIGSWMRILTVGLGRRHRPRAFHTSITGILATVAFAYGPDVDAAPAALPTRPPALTPLLVSVLAPPHPVFGSDDRLHLAYELVVTNVTQSIQTVDSVEALDPANHETVLATLHGPALGATLSIFGNQPGTSLARGQAARIFMDVVLDKNANVPTALEHRLTVSPKQPPTTMFGGFTLVSDQVPVVFAPPLEGSGWVDSGGCCAPASYHRTGTLPINGRLRAAQRFAIDFVQLNADDRLFSGNQQRLANWKYFGANIHAVADGVVVSTVDGQPNQVPGGFASGATLETAAGNAIIEDIGNGHFALYAHLQPSSLRVKKGDRIRQGQIIGLLGNSGNTDAPHLHFHIMDSPSPLDSNGLPFEFISFEIQGRVSSAEALDAGLKGMKVPVDRSAGPSSHHHQMPLVLDVMNFPSSSAG